MRLARLAPLALAGLLAGVPTVRAQDYPARQVTIIVPFAPGGSADITARVYAQKLTERLGKPVVVENKAGAGTVVGASAAARAAPDGYTLLMGGSSALAYNPTVYKKLPYDPVKDFVPLAHVASIPFVLVVQPSMAVHSLTDLIKLAKDKPGQIAFGTAGVGSPAHLCAEYLRSLTGIDITYIPYKGTAPAVTDFLGGQVSVMFVDLPPVLPLIREGKMRALGVTSITRSPAAPEIAPLAEVGVPGYDAGGWLMFVAPANTPTPIVNRLHTEMKEVTATPEVRQRFIGMGLNPIDSPDVEKLRLYVKSEIERWAKVIRSAGLAETQ
jgi:tripartite-type tricarboxylate transporter receptor subunit TctC